MYAQVAVNIPLANGIFDYHLPESLAGQIKPGCLVVVPFGKQNVQGIVLKLSEESEILETRPIGSILDPQPVVTPFQIRVAEELSYRRLAPLAACLDIMLPPGLGQQADTLYEINPSPPHREEVFTPMQKRLYDWIGEQGALRGRQLDHAFPHVDWQQSARKLVHAGILVTHPILPPPGVRPKVVRTVQLACSPETAEANMGSLGRGDALARRQTVLRFLLEEPWPIDLPWLTAQTGCKLDDLLRLAEKGLVTLGETEVWRDPLEKMSWDTKTPPSLTAEQTSVWAVIKAAIGYAAQGIPQKPHLLHGVTGSGKTEIYLQAVEETLRHNRQAIVLVPEISLTPQTIQRFAGRFPGQVGLIHSRLSAGERYDTWRRARAGLLPVIVGPRSALFTPLPDPGLIVIDECHDDSYYQSESQPYYHTIDVSINYAQIAKSLVLMGSATPELNLVYESERSHWPILHLPSRIMAHRQTVVSQMARLGLKTPHLDGDEHTTSLPLPPVHIVDMRSELRDGNRSIFSRRLQDALAKVLDMHQQAILFLNRRGTATYVFCRDCGYVVRCPRCDLPLTYHADENNLQCHICHYRRLMPTKCPDCGQKHIRQMGTGTEKVESEVQALFPQAHTLRWDAGTAHGKGANDYLLAHFSNHQADILIGTQMLAKGLDLPLVTLVGVILADVGMSFPDFRANERAFQLLTQVAGRAGRSPLGGEVILQTFQPEHYAIQAAAEHDYKAFYERELRERHNLGYPPFSRLVRLEFRHKDPATAESLSQSMAMQVRDWILKGDNQATEIIGPAPCFFGRVNGLFRWHIILRGPNPIEILRGRPLGEWRVQVDPPNLL